MLFDPEEDFQSFTPSGSDFPPKPIVTFLSSISSPKIPSEAASPEKKPASPLQSTNNPTTTTYGAASSPSTGLQFPISLPEKDQSKAPEELPHLVHFYRTVDRFFHALVTSNFNLIILFLDVNIAVNITLITHAEPNDPGLINIYNTVSNQESANGQ